MCVCSQNSAPHPGRELAAQTALGALAVATRDPCLCQHPVWNLAASTPAQTHTLAQTLHEAQATHKVFAYLSVLWLNTMTVQFNVRCTLHARSLDDVGDGPQQRRVFFGEKGDGFACSSK
jgi:hypothetical protein